MASNGVNGKASTGGSGTGTETWTHKPDKKTTKTIKLKKPQPPKANVPGSWKDTSVAGRDSTAKSPSSESPSSPLFTPIDDISITSHPITDPSDMQLCKICKKPVLEQQFTAHIKNCQRMKAEKARERKLKKEAKEKQLKETSKDKDSGEGDGAKANGTSMDLDDTPNGDTPDKAKPAKKTATGGEDGEKKSKKRKADGDAPKVPKAKKKKEEAKSKGAKPKGPVDVEKQCGVLLPNGQQCARSLTCKSHSMGAKRDVPGRSLPYDMLLQAYQRKNQAKQQKAAFDANAPTQDEADLNAGPVDSDEERDAVMNAIARSRPQPLAEPMMIGARTKYQYLRVKDMFANAFGGARTGAFGFFGVSSYNDGMSGGLGSNMLPTMNNDTNTGFDNSSRRPSIAQGGLNSAGSRTSFSGALPSTGLQRKQSGNMQVPPSPVGTAV